MNLSSWWMKPLAGLGGTVLTIQFLRFFLHFGRRTGTPQASEHPAPGSDAFLQALSQVIDSPVRRGGTATLLQNGDAFFPALLADIEGARHSIHIMSYIWKDSAISDRLLDALEKRLQAGVEVRIMLDTIGSHRAPLRRMRALRKAGAHVKLFSPPLSSRFLYLNKRNHRRAFVIDGRVGYTGGMAVAKEWTGDAHDPDHWHDTMIRLTGPMAHAIQAAFAQFWVYICGEELFGSKYYPHDEKTDGPAAVALSHSPTGPLQPLLHFMAFSIAAARKRIYIANAYFAPSLDLRQLLVEKSRQGVDVRIMLPGPHMDRGMVRQSARLLYDTLLEAGIRVYEYQPTMLHAKHLVIDDAWTVIGSADIGFRSLKLNHENVVGIGSESLAREMYAMFEQDFARSREITLDEWRRRPLLQRMAEYASMALMAQY